MVKQKDSKVKKDLIEAPETKAKGKVEKVAPPDINSPEWHDYAMSFFTPKELIDGNPLVAGLRRVAELLIGEIISSKPTSVTYTETSSPIGRATVVYEIQFLIRSEWYDTEISAGDYVKTYADTAEVWEGNTDDLFAVHAAATASTRAEGRALRKALKLRVVAAEELCKKDVSKFLGEQTGQDEDRINGDQIKFIDNRCRKMDINVWEFINSGQKEYKSIYEVKKDTAAKMIKELMKSSNDASASAVYTTTGYKEGWNS